jgi:hypothetical protein
MPPNYRKRRVPHGPSKSELRSARNERAELQKTRTDTLSQRFPQVGRIQLDLRLEAPIGGATLDHVQRSIQGDQPLDLGVSCPSSCHNGRFSLFETVEDLLNSSKESYQGMATCQMASYADFRSPCGTKLYYQISIQYKGE